MPRKPKFVQPEPAYRTAYADTGALVCPECGQDLNSWPGDAIKAHAAMHWPPDLKDLDLSDEAIDRNDALLEMAKAVR